MKKILLLAGAASLLAFNLATAQDEVAVVSQETIVSQVVPCKTNYYTSHSDNWFIELGAGINMPLVENPTSKNPQVTLNYGVGVGKWFSPYLGWRTEFSGGAIHWNMANDKMAHMNSVSANADLMWDMFNSLGGVNSKRVFSIVPFVGVGGTFNWNYRHDVVPGQTPCDAVKAKTNEWLLPVSAGLQLRLRLCQYVDFFAQARCQFYGDAYNNCVVDRPIDINFSALGGFSFNLGGRDFRSYNPCDYLSYIDGVNQQVNDLRAELANTAAALAVANSQLPCPEVVASEVVVNETAPLLSTVRFSINSSKVTAMEKVNIYNVAEWMKANPDQNVVITGFADKDTGTSNYNMKLSERRAQTVYNILTKEYGINPARLAMVAAGSDLQLYNVNNWNRIVVFSVAE